MDRVEKGGKLLRAFGKLDFGGNVVLDEIREDTEGRILADRETCLFADWERLSADNLIQTRSFKSAT